MMVFSLTNAVRASLAIKPIDWMVVFMVYYLNELPQKRYVVKVLTQPTNNVLISI